jgi:hypothetical protein
MESFEHLLHQLHLSYFQARKNKRNTHNHLRFEIQQETQLYDLAKAIYNRSYTPKPCIAFIIKKPVMREIFASYFVDRVIHHLIYRCIYKDIDKKLINDSYSCRKSKGTHYGIKRIDHFIRSCSNNYSKDCYILKLDIKGYFMAMNKTLLFQKVKKELVKRKNKLNFDLPLVLYLIEKTIYNDPTENCNVKGQKSD